MHFSFLMLENVSFIETNRIHVVARNGSDSYNTDTVRGRLRLLILGRPPLQTLQEKGIIKGNFKFL